MEQYIILCIYCQYIANIFKIRDKKHRPTSILSGAVRDGDVAINLFCFAQGVELPDGEYQDDIGDDGDGPFAGAGEGYGR